MHKSHKIWRCGVIVSPNTSLRYKARDAVQLSVLIKTYNEAAKISHCLTSVFEALSEWGGKAEIIVADSRSTDSTVEIASRFPVTVVRLSPQEPRGCGIGVQMGFQHSVGDFVLFLDGDMELQRGFLPAAFHAFTGDPRLAGVAGIVEETAVRNRFDRHRIITQGGARCGVLPFLDGGGLYRRAAIDDAGGYAADRNLHAYEEAELGLRLGARGWKLVRLPMSFAKHTGHAVSTTGMILRMWTRGRLAAGGVLLRRTLGQPWFLRVLRMFVHSWAVIVFWPVFVALVLLAPYAALALLAAASVILLLLVLRKRSVVDATFSAAMWHVAAAGMLCGLTRRLTSPSRPISTEVITAPSAGKRFRSA